MTEYQWVACLVGGLFGKREKKAVKTCVRAVKLCTIILLVALQLSCTLNKQNCQLCMLFISCFSC